MIKRVCNLVLIAFAILYALALGLLLIGTFGLFGNDRDPLSGVFLIPLGLPWNLLIDWAPEAAWPWLAAAAPAVNLVILFAICRLLAARRSAVTDTGKPS
jgi:hypothetical protein